MGKKRARRDAILTAAVKLLDERGLELTTLSAIARVSGSSKANIYRYFESREAILLAVTLEEIDAWFEEVTTRLAPLAGSGDVDAAAQVLATSISARPRACALLSALASVLERNVSVEVVAAFKRRFYSKADAPTHAVHVALPSLSPDNARMFMNFFFVFVAGAWPVSNPGPAAAEVLARPEFSGMCVKFEDALRRHARTVLRGLCCVD